MTVSWALVGAGVVLFFVSDLLRQMHLKRNAERAPGDVRRVPLWVRALKPVGLACLSVGAILLIGSMFGHVGPESLA